MQWKKLCEKLKWEFEYATAQWDYIDQPHSPDLMILINKYLEGGSLLDLGCGTGNTVAGLQEYSSYEGVDISKIAIHRANRRYRNVKNHFTVAHVLEYEPSMSYNVILLSEVIYYIDFFKLLDFLHKYKKHLKNRGVFIVQIWQKVWYEDIIKLIMGNFHILENISFSELNVVLVFN